MNIHQSEKYDILCKACRDWKGDTIYMVIYGLQVSTSESEEEALMEYMDCVKHAMACNAE